MTGINNAVVARQCDLIDISTAVKRGYCSRATIMRDIKSGKLAAVKIKGKNYIPVDDLERIHGDQAWGGVINAEQLYEQVVKQVASTAPVFTDEQKATIISLLTASAEI